MAAITPAEIQAIKDGHAAGKTLGAIAAELGRTKSTVSRHAKLQGLTWDREQTATAAQAKVIDNRAKRATLESRFLDEAALLLDALHQPHVAFNFGGKDNTYAERTLTEPDTQSKRSLIQAAGTAVDKALKLADADRATTGAQAGKSLVGSLFAALAVTQPADDNTNQENTP